MDNAVLSNVKICSACEHIGIGAWLPQGIFTSHRDQSGLERLRIAVILAPSNGINKRNFRSLYQMA